GGAGQLTEAGQAIEGGVQLSIADLRPFSGLAGHPLSGSIELAADAAREGAAGFKASLRGSAKDLRTGIAAGDALLGDTVTIAGEIADLAEPKAELDGTYRAYGLDGSLALAAEQKGDAELVLPRFRLTAADSAIEGSLRIALDAGLMRGSITGRIPDLGRWSK